MAPHCQRRCLLGRRVEERLRSVGVFLRAGGVDWEHRLIPFPLVRRRTVMKLSSRHLRRRDLIQWLGGAALALPCLELFEGEARAQAVAGAKSKFVVFCYTPDGVNQAAFSPTRTPTSYHLSPILNAFHPFKDNILILVPHINRTPPVTGTSPTYTHTTP